MKKISMVVSAVGLFALLVPYSYSMEPSTSSGSSGSMEKQRGTIKHGETDITDTKGEKGSIPSKYTVMPVARGKKIEVEHEMIGDTVVSPKGEELGKIESLIMDSKTQKIEYAMISIGDTGQLQAHAWSHFKVDKNKGNVVLNLTKEQLQPGLSSQDLSPDVREVVDREMKTLRERESKIDRSKPGDVTEQPAAGGMMGEEKAGGGGPAGPRALPPGPAPQFEGGK
ncbi:MAG: PRC-barrel domain-containing protein [Nitrospiraceae bacterium]